MAFGLLLQVVTFIIGQWSVSGSPWLWLSLLSGCLGVCSVCLTAQRNILTYVFGFAQVITYTWLCVTQRFYGEIAINAYYFVTMIYGVYVWRKRLQSDQLVAPRSLSLSKLLLIVSGTVVLGWIAGWGLATWTDDTQPYLDAFTTVPALVAQILMILVYREHWYLWLAVDILSVALWWRAGDYCMVSQYSFWCLNCLYGLYHWRSSGMRSE